MMPPHSERCITAPKQIEKDYDISSPNSLTSKNKPASKSQFFDLGIGYRPDFTVPLLHPLEIAALTAVADTEIMLLCRRKRSEIPISGRR